MVISSIDGWIISGRLGKWVRSSTVKTILPKASALLTGVVAVPSGVSKALIPVWLCFCD